MKWIKCSERMPENTEEVLTWNGEYYVEAYVGNYWQTDSAELDKVTHWAKLPTPPKKDLK